MYGGVIGSVYGESIGRVYGIPINSVPVIAIGVFIAIGSVDVGSIVGLCSGECIYYKLDNVLLLTQLQQ